MNKRGQVYSATMKLTEEVAGRNVLNCGKKLKKKLWENLSTDFIEFLSCFSRKNMMNRVCQKTTFFYSIDRKIWGKKNVFLSVQKFFSFVGQNIFFFDKKNPTLFPSVQDKCRQLFPATGCRINSQLLTPW